VTFRARLVLAAFYVLTAVVLALVIPLALTVERRAESDFRSAVLGDAAILAARVADLVPQASVEPSGGAGGAAAADSVAALVEESASDPERRVVVVDEQGRVVADSQGAVQPGTQFATAERPELQTALRGMIDTRKRTSETLGDELLLVTVPVVDQGQVAGAVRVSASTNDIQSNVRESWLRLAALGVAVIAAGLVLAWLVAVPLSRQIRNLSLASARLGRGELDARAPEEGPQELEQLARSFNRMADSLGGNLEAQREFVANASHQLRTPLTGMRLRLEAIRAEGGPAAEEAEKAEADLERLSSIVDDLLALAGASSREATAVSVDLAEAAREAASRWGQAAEAAGTRIELETRGRPLAWADREDVAHALDNLVDNAIRYSPEGAQVRIDTERRDGSAVLLVSDTGPGIPPEERARVFERFYRGQTGRRAGPGSGLGLPIVAALVERWGGEVRILDGPGTRIEAAFRSPPTER
jgi:signal transduction histidine kinase